MRAVHFSFACLVLAGWIAADPRLTAQEKGSAPRPLTLFAQFRQLLDEGKPDLAAAFLGKFLESNPTDADFLEIEKRYGTTAFTQLRAVPRWSDDPAAEQKARQYVEDAVKRAREVTTKLLYSPERVTKYIRNLGASYEERVFAELELRRTGDYAIPFMVEQLRTTPDRELYAGIIGAIPKLESQTVAGWLAALDELNPFQQFDVLTALARRPDLLSLTTQAQTDITPHLWHVLAQPERAGPAMRAFAEDLLNKLYPGLRAGNRSPEVELVALARTFADGTARFAGTKTNPDGTPATVPVWVWQTDGSGGLRLVKLEDVPLGQAREYFGLRYARWALDRRPDYLPAQMLMLALAAEQAMARSRFGWLATSEPAVHRLLADAPSAVLDELLRKGLNQNRTALVAAALQILSERGDRSTVAAMTRALDYPDPQVQFLAAVGLLRSSAPVSSAVRGKIVDVLRRAAGADPLTPPEAQGTALIADPNRLRGDALAVMLRGLGYQAEVFGTGRDLLRRVARSSDFDLIFVDHHTPNPELIDLIGQLQTDAKVAGRPLFVIASTDRTPLPTFDQALVRFAALIAATENERVPMPAPYVPDLRLTPEQLERERTINQRERDNQFFAAMTRRRDRLQRVVETTGLELSPTQRTLYELRLELITFAALAAEYPLSAESAPATAERLRQIRRQIAEQPASPPYGTGTPTLDLLKLMERFEADLARVPTARQRFEAIYAKMDPVELGIPVETFRNASAEAQLARMLRNYPAVKVIPEPFSRSNLAELLEAVFRSEPALTPRDPAVKKLAQKVAVEWLRKMAGNELPGYDVRAAEAELRQAVRNDELAEAAIDAVEHFPGADAQQALLTAAVSVTPQRPLPIRLRAADAVIRHVQRHGKLVGRALLDQLVTAADREPDPTLRGKLNVLRGLLVEQPLALPDPQTGKPVPNPEAFVNRLRAYNPPLTPPTVPGKDVPKDKEPPAEPKKDE